MHKYKKYMYCSCCINSCSLLNYALSIKQPFFTVSLYKKLQSIRHWKLHYSSARWQNYSRALSRTASSCTDLEDARFWIGSKNVWDARFCTFLHVFARFCTFLHVFLINEYLRCTFLHVFTRFCTFLHVFAHFCTFFARFLVNETLRCTFFGK